MQFYASFYPSKSNLSENIVNCEELDFLNDIARDCRVTGSRVMGGDFGGCTINLVKDELYDSFISRAIQSYRKHYLLFFRFIEIRF